MQPGQIERDKGVTGLLQLGDDFVANCQHALEIGDGHLDARDIAVVAHADLAESPLAQRPLPPADLIQHLGR